MMIQNGDHLAHLLEQGGINPKDQKCWPWPSFDCTDWAEAFCKRAKELGHDIDLDWARSWFASALMRGYDEGRSESHQRTDFTGKLVEQKGL